MMRISHALLTYQMITCKLWWLAFSFAVISFCPCQTVEAQDQGEVVEETSIDTESALRRITGTWYDVDSGKYRPPSLRKPIEDKIRNDGWLGKEVIPKQSNRKPWTFGGLGLSGEAFGWVVLIVLGTVLLFGIILIAYYYLGDRVPAFRKKPPKKALKIDPMKVEDLPFEVPTATDDPLAYAERLMREGRYNEAVIYLYGYMLLALDQARKIHLQKGKTNRMYLRELRGNEDLRKIVSQLILAFEDVFFGRYDIDAARFSSLWKHVDTFHQLLQPTPAAQATTTGVAPA